MHNTDITVHQSACPTASPCESCTPTQVVKIASLPLTLPVAFISGIVAAPFLTAYAQAAHGHESLNQFTDTKCDDAFVTSTCCLSGLLIGLCSSPYLGYQFVRTMLRWSCTEPEVEIEKTISRPVSSARNKDIHYNEDDCFYDTEESLQGADPLNDSIILQTADDSQSADPINSYRGLQHGYETRYR